MSFQLDNWPPMFVSATCSPESPHFVGIKGKGRSHEPSEKSVQALCRFSGLSEAYRRRPFAFKPESRGHRAYQVLCLRGRMESHELAEAIGCTTDELLDAIKPAISAGLINRRRAAYGKPAEYSLGEFSV